MKQNFFSLAFVAFPWAPSKILCGAIHYQAIFCTWISALLYTPEQHVSPAHSQ